MSFVQRAEASLNQQKANLLSTKSSLARSEATFERAKLDFERNKKLYNEDVISTSEWELSKQNFKIAQNDLESAKASVEASKYVVKSSRASLVDAKENLRKTSVLSPISGTVSKLVVKKGERVVGTSQFAGTEMLRIADLNNMEVRVDVNENDIIRISLGDTAIIDVDAYTHFGKKFKGVVTKIASTAKDKVSADAVTEFEVKIKILPSSYADLKADGNHHPFKPGMTASVDIITKTKANIRAVPLAAVTVRTASELEEWSSDEDDTKTKRRSRKKDERSDEEEKKIELIFVNDNGVAKVVKVETGISDYENIEIISELSDSAQVIIGPFIAVSKRLKDGDLVKKAEKKKSKKSKN
ncbi:ABC transporter, RND-adapter-like protein [hydrothermal vent metagenome]|uniref:ABC transporter, RND-adapter-like protein n=1 Tax=hydrothermal vent metagenome TaxID=652676 RepID=A0A3B0UWQ4_9ZZZZ